MHINALIAEAVERAGRAAERPASDQAGAASHAGASQGDSVRRLIDRLLLVCKRRAREGEAVAFRLARETGWNRLTFSTTARDADWSESDLLELRIATLTAALLGGSLELLTESLRTTLRLQCRRSGSNAAACAFATLLANLVTPSSRSCPIRSPSDLSLRRPGLWTDR
jgi:hypothetical protein